MSIKNSWKCTRKSHSINKWSKPSIPTWQISISLIFLSLFSIPNNAVPFSIVEIDHVWSFIFSNYNFPNYFIWLKASASIKSVTVGIWYFLDLGTSWHNLEQNKLVFMVLQLNTTFGTDISTCTKCVSFILYFHSSGKQAMIPRRNTLAFFLSYGGYTV